MATEESGTMPSPPTSVEAAQGRGRRFVRWVNHAWHDIQMARPDWQWMRGVFSAELLPFMDEQSPETLGVARFGDWRLTDREGRSLLRIIEPSNGDAVPVAPLTWERMRWYREARSEPGRPQSVAVSPSGALVFYPTPDLPYAVTGEFQRAPQALVRDGDVPEMPVRHHEVIVWRALLRSGVFDEAVPQMGDWRAFLREGMNYLERDQLPDVRLRTAGF